MSLDFFGFKYSICMHSSKACVIGPQKEYSFENCTRDGVKKTEGLVYEGSSMAMDQMLRALNKYTSLFVFACLDRE